VIVHRIEVDWLGKRSESDTPPPELQAVFAQLFGVLSLMGRSGYKVTVTPNERPRVELAPRGPFA
jgi:hypothetical protein